jgi:hypothetical protein
MSTARHGRSVAGPGRPSNVWDSLCSDIHTYQLSLESVRQYYVQDQPAQPFLYILEPKMTNSGDFYPPVLDGLETNDFYPIKYNYFLCSL